MDWKPGAIYEWSCPRCYALAHTTLRQNIKGESWAWFVCPAPGCKVWMPEHLELFAARKLSILRELEPGKAPWGLPGNWPEKSKQQLAKELAAQGGQQQELGFHDSCPASVGR